MNDDTIVRVTRHISEQKELFRALRALDELAINFQVSSTPLGYVLIYAVSSDDDSPSFPAGARDD